MLDNPHIPATDALEHASILQDCANKLIFESALGNSDPTKHLALSALYLGEMAKAIMDDVAQSIGSKVRATTVGALGGSPMPQRTSPT